jgi:tryptophan halogenase
MLGQGIRPRAYDPLADNTPEDVIDNMMVNVKAVIKEVVKRMPTHENFIAENCKALPL